MTCPVDCPTCDATPPRRRGSAATDHAEVADDAPCCAWCRTLEPPCDCELGDEDWMREALRCLAGNLRTAAGLCAAFCTGYVEGFSVSGEGFNGEYAPRLTGQRLREMAQDTATGGYEPGWKPGCGKPAPGWEAP